MTFDEAQDAEISQSEVTDILEELREEYAPTIKMNVFEYDYFRSFCFSDRSFVELVTSISDQVVLIKLGLKHTPLYLMNLSENSLMQAWLHPETIKVVD